MTKQFEAVGEIMLHGGKPVRAENVAELLNNLIKLVKAQGDLAELVGCASGEAQRDNLGRMVSTAMLARGIVKELEDD